jgi:hypothetical protein
MTRKSPPRPGKVILLRSSNDERPLRYQAQPLIEAAGELAFRLSEHYPLLVVQSLARGLRNQPSTTKAQIVRRFCDALDDDEPGLIAVLSSELAAYVAEAL